MKKSYIKYFTALLLFGSNGIAAGAIALSSGEIVLLRAVLGSCMLIAVFFITGRKITVFNNRKDTMFIVLSGIAMAADWLLLFEAYAQIGVGLSMLINYCGPAIVIALSPVVFKERITGAEITALVLALTGACLISGQAAFAGISLQGLACAVISAFSYAAMVICSKKAEGITGLENSALQLLACTVAIVIFACMRGEPVFEIPSDDWGYILWLGIINTGLGCFLYFSSIGRLPAQSVAVCGYIEPLSAVLLSVMFLNETMSLVKITGAVLIIGGALYGELGKKKSVRI